MSARLRATQPRQPRTIKTPRQIRPGIAPSSEPDGHAGHRALRARIISRGSRSRRLIGGNLRSTPWTIETEPPGDAGR